MPRFVETTYPQSTAFEGQETMLLNHRRRWMRLKRSRFFNLIRHSPLNPYHFGIKKIVADTPEQAQELARERNLAQYINKDGVRCTVNFDGSVNEEYEKTGKVLRGRGDVSNRIPRDKDGKLDLMAEEPILFSIIPLEGVSITGHVCMQYKDRVINRVLNDINMEPLYPRYVGLSDYYLVYPSQLGIKPDELIEAMDEHNIKYGQKKYNIFTNNCAKNVAQVLEGLGVKDINFFGPDKLKLRFPTPGNNPFRFGVEDWCLRHGILAKQEEISKLYRYHEIPNLDKRIEEFAKIRQQRYGSQEGPKNENKILNKLISVRKKTAKKWDTLFQKKLKEKPTSSIANYAAKNNSDALIKCAKRGNNERI